MFHFALFFYLKNLAKEPQMVAKECVKDACTQKAIHFLGQDTKF